MDKSRPAEAIKNVIDRYGRLKVDQLNEANTRLLLVDEILEQVLGWPREAFNPEEYVATIDEDGKGQRQWLDYHLKTGEGMTLRLVVEAKRAGKTFSLSVSKQQAVLPLKQLRKNHGPALASAIRQALQYCRDVGTHCFVVTNGAQWIASLAFAHNVAASDISAIVFYSLDDIAAHLSDFIDLLSPAGLASQVLLTRAIAGGSRVPLFARRLNDTLRPGAASSANYLVQPLAALMGICFGDLTDQEHVDMLDDCYVQSETTDQYIRRLESFGGTTLPDSMATAEKLGRRAGDTEGVARALSSEGAFIVAGRMGSGKSTFLAITRRRMQAIPHSGTRMFLYVDLISRTQTQAARFDHDRLIDDICRDLLVQAEAQRPDLDPFANELLREVFSNEIRRLFASLSPASRETPEADARVDEIIRQHLATPLNHLKAYLGYLERREVLVTVLLDNVDRGTEEFERVTFQLAQALARNTHAAVVTSLRETTYESGKTGGFLDVGRNPVLIVVPPSFAAVAAKRFGYARKRFREDLKLWRRFERSLNGVPSDRVLDFAAILSELVLTEGSEIQECISALAGTNIRRALEMLENFATSPNTPLEKLFALHRRAENMGRSDLGAPLEVFLRSIMRMRSVRYSERESNIVNLFQVRSGTMCSHFTSVRILQFLAWRLLQPRGGMDVRVAELTQHLGAIGHGSSEVLEMLNHLGRFGLVGSLSRPEPPWASADTVRLGAAGRYYLDTLLQNREYLRNIVDDTVIYDEQTFASIEFANADQDRTWPQRYDDKARAFLSYLVRRERDELARIGALVGIAPWVRPVAEPAARAYFGTSFAEAVRQPRRR